MAYYSSSYAGSDSGEYNFNSYAGNYDYAQNPAFMANNDHEFNKPYYGYDQSSYLFPNYHALSYPTIAYSATTFSDPKTIEYDPNSGMSQLVIYYSTMELNEPEFDEYDPTPYDGGYDLAQTYGKPLPPSDETCYPRSGSDLNTFPSDAVPTGAIVPLALPNGEERIDEKAIKPQNGSAGQVTEEKPQPQISSRDQPTEAEDNSHDTPDLKPYYEDEDSKEHHVDDGYYSGSGNGYNGGQFNEYDKLVPPQYPSGYGLEAMDLCESLFGYWPCLSRMKKRENCCEDVADDGGYCKENIWKGTADYLFGRPYPYGGRGEEEGSSYGGGLVYAYERHCPTQAQYRQVEHNENSW